RIRGTLRVRGHELRRLPRGEAAEAVPHVAECEPARVVAATLEPLNALGDRLLDHRGRVDLVEVAECGQIILGETLAARLEPEELHRLAQGPRRRGQGLGPA